MTCTTRNRLTTATGALAAALARWAAPTAAAATAAGPDSFGYTAEAVPFSFEDISSSGTPVLGDHDDAFEQVELPFAVGFYGTQYDSVFVATNGLLSFAAGASPHANQELTGSVRPDLPIAAVLWDDWVTFWSSVDAVYHQTVGAAGSRRVIVQWNVVQHFPGSPGTATFQAVLYEGRDDIEYRYLDTELGDASSAGGTATVGIRDVAGDTNGRNLQWSHDVPAIGGGSAIRFFRNRAPLCSTAVATRRELWPPDHGFRDVAVAGVTDPDGDSVTVTITGVTQDEAVAGPRAEDPAPDAATGASPSEVTLRAARSGAGDGRVYAVGFSASDGRGGSCTGTAMVGVPHDRRSRPAADSAPPSYDSFGP